MRRKQVSNIIKMAFKCFVLLSLLTWEVVYCNYQQFRYDPRNPNASWYTIFFSNPNQLGRAIGVGGVGGTCFSMRNRKACYGKEVYPKCKSAWDALSSMQFVNGTDCIHLYRDLNCRGSPTVLRPTDKACMNYFCEYEADKRQPNCPANCNMNDLVGSVSRCDYRYYNKVLTS